MDESLDFLLSQPSFVFYNKLVIMSWMRSVLKLVEVLSIKIYDKNYLYFLFKKNQNDFSDTFQHELDSWVLIFVSRGCEWRVLVIGLGERVVGNAHGKWESWVVSPPWFRRRRPGLVAPLFIIKGHKSPPQPDQTKVWNFQR